MGACFRIELLQSDILEIDAIVEACVLILTWLVFDLWPFVSLAGLASAWPNTFTWLPETDAMGLILLSLASLVSSSLSLSGVEARCRLLGSLNHSLSESSRLSAAVVRLGGGSTRSNLALLLAREAFELPATGGGGDGGGG